MQEEEAEEGVEMREEAVVVAAGVGTQVLRWRWI